MIKKTAGVLVVMLLLIFTPTLDAQVIIPDNPMSDSSLQSLNGIWKFKYIPSVDIGKDSVFYKPEFLTDDWKDIWVPGHWELQGFAEPQYGGGVKSGTGLYRTDFLIPETWASNHHFMVFNGVLYGFDFWINGKYAGNWSSSFNRRIFDVSDYLKFGKKNSLAVKVTTRRKGWEFDTNDCWGLSGIFRDINLISVPTLFIRDIAVKTYANQKSNARIDLAVILQGSSGPETGKNPVLTGRLFSPDGKIINEFSSEKFHSVSETDTATIFNSWSIENPRLWNAETPFLYTLELTLKLDMKVIEKVTQKIGIRQVTVDNGIFNLNGKAIKLRGVDHHDLDPVVGRSLTKEMILNDLNLIKKANINFIRTSHYPPHPTMIDLCDSLGIYLMCEVPFGYDGGHLNDSTYLDILLKRAEATIQRDKNHPSVIIWSIGNENALTEICLKTGEYVKRLDDTRPICYPQGGSYFMENYKTIPRAVDLLTPHYGNAETLETYGRLLDKPIIATEYAHALGLDFDKMESMWEIMYRYPQIAGGAVWHFHDQGIFRKADHKVDLNSFTYSAWPDSVHYYDTFGNKGADGLVYSNRVPQVDYFEVRKVYAPVRVLTDSILIRPGIQLINLLIENRFDFSDLTGIRCMWTLTADNKSISAGSFVMQCTPHETTTISVQLQLPEKLTADYYLLNLNFYDHKNNQFSEKTCRLLYPGNRIDNRNLVSEIPDIIDIGNNNDSISVKAGETVFTLDRREGSLKIQDPGRNQLLLKGPFARVGRKPTMSIESLRLKDQTGVSTNWNPYILKNPEVIVNEISEKEFKCKYRFERGEKKGEFIEGSVSYIVSDSGWIYIDYRFSPINATGFFLEAGISFLVPSEFTELRWIGNGPFPSYPGKSMLNEFGFYHLSSLDINYQGNRSQVQIFMLTDQQGNGFVIHCNDADIAVERIPEGILLSHNALVSGRYNKNSEPDQIYRAGNVKYFKGSFSIFPVNGKSVPHKLVNLFGDLNQTAIPFKPFYHSYDQ